MRTYFSNFLRLSYLAVLSLLACTPGKLGSGTADTNSSGAGGGSGSAGTGGTGGGCGELCDCGNGTIEEPEQCDDGKQRADDGCSPQCAIEDGWSCDGKSPTLCEQVPAPPTLDGETSADHSTLLWTWDLPQHTTVFQYRVDAAAFSETTDQRFTAPAFSDGLHTIEVKACNSLGGCSSSATFETTIEHLGPGYPGVWKGVARPNLTTTAIGNVTPVACYNCFNNQGGTEALDVEGANEKIARALAREADAIEIDVAAAAGSGNVLCATYDDDDICTDRPTLKELTDHSALRDADAILFVQIKEKTMGEDAFADLFLGFFDENRQYARNGRPLVLHAFEAELQYIEAIKGKLDDYPFIAPYVKFSVLYGYPSTRSVAEMQSAIKTDVLDKGFEMVAFDHRVNHVVGLSSYARAQGLASGLFIIPAYFGEAMVATVREEFDFLTSDLRVDVTRHRAEEANTLAYVDPSGCASAQDTHVSVHRNTDGEVTTDQIALKVPPTSSRFGSPGLTYDAEGGDRFGCSLDFRSSQSLFNRSLDLGEVSASAGEGFLVFALVNFAQLSGLTEPKVILGNAESAGFSLELLPAAGDEGVTLRAAYHVNGSYVAKGYDVTNTGLLQNPALNESDLYFIAAAYDGDGGVYTWIDTEKVAGAGPYTGDVTPSVQSLLVGGAPCAQCATGAQGFFDGLIQRVGVLRWGGFVYYGSSVN